MNYSETEENKIKPHVLRNLRDHECVLIHSEGGFRRVTLPDPAQRGGLLAHGALLATTSYPDRTSPVLRGKWLLNNILGLVRACQQGLGIAALPDYLVEENNRLVQLFGESDSIQLDTYFVYPEELKSVARVQVFRDFIVSKAQRWPS